MAMGQLSPPPFGRGLARTRKGSSLEWDVAKGRESGPVGNPGFRAGKQGRDQGHLPGWIFGGEVQMKLSMLCVLRV